MSLRTILKRYLAYVSKNYEHCCSTQKDSLLKCVITNYFHGGACNNTSLAKLRVFYTYINVFNCLKHNNCSMQNYIRALSL